MKRHVCQFLYSIVILAMLIIPISTSTGLDSNNNIAETDHTESVRKTSVPASDWLAGWNYRRSHQIIGATGAGENYQIEIIVHYGYGTSFGQDVYCNGWCQSDFDDIRFTEDDGYSLLDYWTENVDDYNVSTFWVEVSEDLNFNTTIYMYYGNSGVTTRSNGAATFIFFDDFESTSLGSDPDPNKWWLESAQDPDDYVRIALDPAGGDNQVAEASETGDSVANVAWANDWGPVGNIAIGHKFRYDLDYKGYYTTKDSSQTFIFIEQLEYLGVNNHQWYDVVSDYFDYTPAFVTVTDEWYSWEYRFFEDEMTVLDRDNDIMGIGGYCFSTINDTRTTCTRYGLRHGANTWWTDDMYVRKFVSAEPTHGDWGESATLRWHHDCSNMTAFDGVGNDEWLWEHSAFGIRTASGTLNSSGQFIYASDLGTPPAEKCWFGPLRYHTLSNPFQFDGFRKLDVEFEIDPNGVAGDIGGAFVLIHDETGKPILRLQVRDPYGYTTDAMPGAAYHFANGTIVTSGVGVLVPSPYIQTLSIERNATGLYANLPGVGERFILDPNSLENRQVSHVSIWIAGSKEASSPPYPLTDIVRVHDISLTWTPTTASWHHDCSDTSGFVYNDSWNINWMTWDIQPGSLTSNGTSLTISGIATGSGYHGPVYEYELPQSLLVRNINTFSAIMNADNSLSSYLGYQVVMLGDANRNPVLSFSFGDGWSDYTQGAYGISYVYANGSRVGYGSGYPVTWTSYNGEMNVSYSESGLMAYVEGVGQQVLSGLSEADLNREIKYVALASSRFGSDPMFPLLVDEIYLNHEITSESIQPFIDDVEDFGYEAGTSDNAIVWNIANFAPTSYELFRNGGLISSGAWPGGNQLVVDIDNLAPGEYEYLVVIYGDGSVEVSDTVIVAVVDTTSPSLGHPPNVNYEFGTGGHSVVWSVADLYPGSYIISLDEMPIEINLWTSGTIALDIDGLDLGEYNFSILVVDSSGNFAMDSVIVTVVDTTSPIIDHPTDIVIDLDMENIQITWRPTDLLPFNYEIYQNGTLVAGGTWASGENLTYALPEGLSTGTYNYTVIVWDTSGNYNSDTVLVNIGTVASGDYLVISISIGSIAVIIIVVGLILQKRNGPQSVDNVGYEW
ncbi:MAG: DUF2341 domain-containing protein [Candidatus Thorarchaeota archaeon]